MSKIQEALGRLQASKKSTSPDVEESIIVAQLADRENKTDSYAASGKCLHVDSDALREAGLLAPEYHAELLANQYRDIKRPLIAHAFGKRATRIENGNLIMVSSALSGEGKTFTSINLALSMARERDHKVLLVDADVAKPHTSEMFGAHNEEGLLDLLDNRSASIQSLMLATDIDNLSLLPAGRPRANATELLASEAMERVCSTLGQLSEGQIVVFDSPPMLQTSEAKVLAGLAGQIVMVVKAEETSQDAVVGALASLDEGKAVNLVLNQARAGYGEFRYGYGYGNSYGYGEKSKKADSSGSKRDLFD